MNIFTYGRSLAAAFMVSLGFSLPAQAAITTFFSSTPDCLGTSAVGFATSGPTVQVSLCATTTSPTKVCGHTVLLQSAAGQGGRFNVLSRTLGANYSDPNSDASPTPLVISNPPAAADLGGTVAGVPNGQFLIIPPVAATANQLLATFTLAPQASATNSSYAITLAPVSMLAVDTDNTCGAATDSPITATLTLNRVASPTFTSNPSTTFALGAANTFNVTAAGDPTISFSVSAGLPATVSLSTAGVLSGSPLANGSFPVTITATNGSGMTTQSFTLTVAGQASQVISFAGPLAQVFNPAVTIPLSAVSSSGLPVAFTSSTTGVCTVPPGGTNVTMVTTGTCTINANQSGNGTFLPAVQVSRSFGITTLGTTGSFPLAAILYFLLDD